jgi:ring-1,2-phenylacetyl-CoA epoxidase subunit PaaC
MTRDEALFEYLLRLGDTDVVLAQRLGEWIGHGPVLEEDIGLANVGLDLLGQGRLWLSLAGEVETRMRGRGRDEDELAFLRDGGAYRNLLLAELPNGDFAMTMARQFCFDQWHWLLLGALAQSTEPRIAEIAAKAAKEAAYHVERSADWVVRLGDGTPESTRRMEAALIRAWPYVAEFFGHDAVDDWAVANGDGPARSSLQAAWEHDVNAVLAEAKLARPATTPYVSTGSQGVHSEHLGFILAEMQMLQRRHPGARW